GTVPETPLAMGLEFDAGGSTNQLTIRKGVLSLTPTERAANVLQLTGTLDFSRTNALSGDLDLTSESLDLTRYFDLFVQAPADQPARAPAPAPTPAPPGPQQEPEPMNLPIGSLTIDTRVNRLFLRQLAAEDLTAT